MEGFNNHADPLWLELLVITLIITTGISLLYGIYCSILTMMKIFPRPLIGIYWMFTLACLVMQYTMGAYMGIMLYALLSPVWLIVLYCVEKRNPK